MSSSSLKTHDQLIDTLNLMKIHLFSDPLIPAYLTPSTLQWSVEPHQKNRRFPTWVHSGVRNVWHQSKLQLKERVLWRIERILMISKSARDISKFIGFWKRCLEVQNRSSSNFSMSHKFGWLEDQTSNKNIWSIIERNRHDIVQGVKLLMILAVFGWLDVTLQQSSSAQRWRQQLEVYFRLWRLNT